MTPKELADQLTGIEYGRDFSATMRAFAAQAKTAEMVIAYGYSDDLLKFEGAISEEVGAYEGVTVMIDRDGILPSFERASEDEESCANYLERKPKTQAVEAVWDDSAGWTIKTDIPHEAFAIVEDGDVISRGIVFALADLAGQTANPAGEAFSEDVIERIDAAIAEALGDAMDCTRNWSAWNYGMMSADDFCRVADYQDRIAEIRSAVLEAMKGA